MSLLPNFSFNTGYNTPGYDKSCNMSTVKNILTALDRNFDGTVDQLEFDSAARDQFNYYNMYVPSQLIPEYRQAEDFLMKNYRDLARSTGGDGLSNQQMDRIHLNKLDDIARQDSNSNDLSKQDLIRGITNNQTYSQADTGYVKNLLVQADQDRNGVVSNAEWQYYMENIHGQNLGGQDPNSIVIREKAEGFISQNFNNIVNATSGANTQGIQVNQIDAVAARDYNSSILAVGDLNRTAPPEVPTQPPVVNLPGLNNELLSKMMSMMMAVIGQIMQMMFPPSQPPYYR